MDVLGRQARALGLDGALRAQELGHHRRTHREELGIALVVAVGVEGEVHGDGAGRLAVEQDGNANQARLGAARAGRWNARFITSGSRAVAGITTGLPLDDAPTTPSPTL